MITDYTARVRRMSFVQCTCGITNNNNKIHHVAIFKKDFSTQNIRLTGNPTKQYSIL